MGATTADPRAAVLRAAQAYARLARAHLALEAQLGDLEGQLRAAYAEVRELAPAAFGATADTAAWEGLYAEIGRESGDADILAALALPRPRDGSRPSSWWAGGA
jgi:hypothetical protein